MLVEQGHYGTIEGDSVNLTYSGRTVPANVDINVGLRNRFVFRAAEREE
jgi:hypothetical protein